MSVLTAEPVVAPPLPDDRPPNGGMSARRAVVRWAWRMFRREWKQQVLVLALLGIAVAASVAIATVAYNVAPAEGNADFGTASTFVEVQGGDADLAETVDKAADLLGTIEPIGHRPLAFPGSTETFDLRAQGLDGPFGGPMLALVDGRAPSGDDEVAITDEVAARFGVAIGDVVELNGTARTVVGTVENPSDLGDEFALVPLSQLASSAALTMLTNASIEPQQVGELGSGGVLGVGHRADISENVVAAIGVFAISSVALLMIALIAAASFVVIAHRRMRQLGMIGAMGASERHVRLVMVANGAVLGAVAAIAGAVLGIVGWIVAAPRLEGSLGFRVDVGNVPWWLVLVGMALAVLTSIAAAWWPARAVARMPAVVALSGRPAPPVPTHRSAVVAGACVAIGIGCLLAAGDLSGETTVRWRSVVLVLSGTLLTIIGVLLASPLAIRLLSRIAPRLPLAPRLALRDLGRYQARSGAALAAISLSLGIPVAVVVIASASEHSASAGNLSDHQLIVGADGAEGPFLPPDLDLDLDLDALRSEVDAIASTLDASTVVELVAVEDPEMPARPNGTRPTMSLGKRTIDDEWRGEPMTVASPELLALYGLDEDDAAETPFWTTDTGAISILGGFDPALGGTRPELLSAVGHLSRDYSSMPGALVTAEEVARRGWTTHSSARWFIATDAPISDAQLADARAIAEQAGLSIESRDEQPTLRTVRSAATAIGMLLALAVLAMTVGLIRNEAAGDLRTLTATGATSGTRRVLTAATAAALAVLGVVLGIAGAYAVLLAGPTAHVAEWHSVPVRELLMIAIGTPVIAGAAGWLLAGRMPRAIGRQPTG